MEFQLDLQALVINRLMETAALVLIDFKARTYNGVALILVNQFRCFFLSFRVFRGLEVQQLNFRTLGIHLPTKQTKKRQNFGGEDQLRYFFFSCHFVCFVG